jgi:EmrB/QacA subfamily drug resistance transporter
VTMTDRAELPEFITTQLPRWSTRPEISRGRRQLVLFVCCTGLFIVSIDNTIVNVALPSIRSQLHASVSGLQWTVAAYTIVLATLMMVAGAAADRFGRRTVLQAGLALFTLGSWLCSLAPSLSWLIAFRIVQAVGGSMLNPVAASIISHTFTDGAERARAIGIWGGMFGWAMALGPVLGGLLTGIAGWRSVFWVNIPIGLTAIVLTVMFVPESRAPKARRPDPVGQFLVTVMLGSLTYAIIEGPDDGWGSLRIIGLFAVVAASLTLTTIYESRRNEPFIDPRFFRSVPFASAVLTAICAFAALGGFLFLATLYLQDVQGLSPLQAGLRLLPAAAGMSVCAPLSGRIIARRGTRIPMLIGGAGLTLSCAALARATGETTDRLLVLAIELFGIGFGFVNAAITTVALSGVPRAQSGVAGGISSASRQVGQSLGVAVVGAMLAAGLHGSMRTGFVTASLPDWWLTAGCGYLILVLGLVATGPRALATAARIESDSASLARLTVRREWSRALPAAWPPGGGPRNGRAGTSRRSRSLARRPRRGWPMPRSRSCRLGRTA